MRPHRRFLQVPGAIAVIMTASFCVNICAEKQSSTWTVSPGQRAEKNPAVPSAESVAKGRDLYAKNCLACHGATGDGKGPVAARLGFSAGDLTRGAEMARRTDGELFWKIAAGRDPMPAFRKEKGLNDAQIWDVVNYIRTLARE